jgi:hypothetical protein
MKSSLPVLSDLGAVAVSAARRFPLPLSSATSAAVFGILSMEARGDVESFATAVLAVPVLLALELCMERVGADRRARLAARLVTIALLAMFWVSHAASQDIVFMVRWLQLLVVAGAALLAGPFLIRGSAAGWWRYTRRLGEAVVTGWASAVAIFLGIAVGLGLFTFLFDLSVDGAIYRALWAVCACLLASWIMLALIPADLDDCEHAEPYPERLGTVLDRFLVPLLLVYTVLLYGYLGKILLEHSLPKGTLGNLIGAIAVLGLTIWIGLAPKGAQATGLSRLYWRWFWHALVPLLGLLLLAVWRRVAEYGLTERRCFLALFGFWMAGLAIYFIGGRRKDLRVIPTSLAGLGLCFVAGPWSPYSVSVHSQFRRLEERLTRLGALSADKLSVVSRTVTADERRAIQDALGFLVARGRQDLVQPWFGQDVSGLSAWKIEEVLPVSVAKEPGLATNFRLLPKDREGWASVRGYSDIWSFEVPQRTSIVAGNRRISVKLRQNGLDLRAGGGDSRIDLVPLLTAARLSDGSQWRRLMPREALEFKTRLGAETVKVVLHEIHGRTRNGSADIKGINGLILLP